MYDSLEEANGYAEILRKAGIPGYVESSGWTGEIDFAQPEYGPYTLSVHPEDEEDAMLILDHAEWEPSSENKGQEKMLIGGVVSGVGLLTSMGDPGMIAEPWAWIPYGMIIAGVALFLKGSKEES